MRHNIDAGIDTVRNRAKVVFERRAKLIDLPLDSVRSGKGLRTAYMGFGVQYLTLKI